MDKKSLRRMVFMKRRDIVGWELSRARDDFAANTSQQIHSFKWIINGF